MIKHYIIVKTKTSNKDRLLVILMSKYVFIKMKKYI